ncbi:MAG: transposase [Victivallales bacterium]|nr:transposase [Victivallales bacterium]
MGALRDILGRFGPGYWQRYGARMPQSHARALFDLQACGTHAMGGHTAACEDCGHAQFVPHSCRNRLCPGCHGAAIANWTAARAGELLPVPYFHVVFTLPSELRAVSRSHQRELLGGLFPAAAEAMQTLATDRLGGRLGMIACIHTWGRNLIWHPHLHMLVPGVAVGADGTYAPLPPGFLLPVTALSEVFRAIYLRLARRAVPETPSAPWSKKWVVNCRPCLEGPVNVLRYLARYARKCPLAEDQILDYDRARVRFRHKDHRTGRTTTCTLAPDEFLRRLLQHAPPWGFHRVRYYGFLAPGARRTLRSLQLALRRGMAALAPAIARLREPSERRRPLACERCGGTRLRHFDFRAPRRVRAPPVLGAA